MHAGGEFDELERGEHTLRVVEGVVVGVYGSDVFVELGPRQQGVIDLERFARPPSVGSTHQFTLGGQEDGLWALSLVEEGSLACWRTAEVGSLVQARLVRANLGGLEAKVGPLHGFMPKSHTGLDRERKPDELVGRTLTCEVLEVDRERQRVLLSRKLVLQRERTSARQRAASALHVGARVSGRVTRVERFGAFVAFGRGLEGLLHVSNLSWERVADARDVLSPGATVDCRVLAVRQGGKRISLGLKQLQPSPWDALEPRAWRERIVVGTVTELARFGAFVRVAPGIVGLLHASETGRPSDERPDRWLSIGDELALRVVAVEPERERMALSLLRRDGSRLVREDVHADVAEHLKRHAARTAASPLGAALLRALNERSRKTGS